MSTTLYSSQTISSSGGQALSPTSVALTKHLVSVHVKLTTGSTSPTYQRSLQLVLAATPFSITPANAPAQLEPSYVLSAQPKTDANGVVYFKSEPIVVEGLNLYAWVNSDALGADITLDAEVEEIA